MVAVSEWSRGGLHQDEYDEHGDKEQVLQHPVRKLRIPRANEWFRPEPEPRIYWRRQNPNQPGPQGNNLAGSANDEGSISPYSYPATQADPRPSKQLITTIHKTPTEMTSTSNLSFTFLNEFDYLLPFKFWNA